MLGGTMQPQPNDFSTADSSMKNNKLPQIVNLGQAGPSVFDMLLEEQ